MRILFIDTALSNLVIGIVQNNSLLYTEANKLSDKLSTITVFYLERAFKKVNLKPADIDIIMIVNGPGSFTGTRIGVTVAKVMAWTLKKNIIPISSLKAMALSVKEADYIVTLIDARSNSYYVAIYDKEYQTLLEEQYISKNDLIKKIKSLTGRVKVVSDVEVKLDDIKVKAVRLDVLKIVKYYQHEEGIKVHTLVPNYLKLLEAEKKGFCD